MGNNIVKGQTTIEGDDFCEAFRHLIRIIYDLKRAGQLANLHLEGYEESRMLGRKREEYIEEFFVRKDIDGVRHKTQEKLKAMSEMAKKVLAESESLTLLSPPQRRADPCTPSRSSAGSRPASSWYSWGTRRRLVDRLFRAEE